MLPLITSVPYVKEWLLAHPISANENSWLFISLSNNQSKNVGSKLSRDGLLKHYQEFYRDEYFPELLKENSITEVDKPIIKNMLTKPWNLYVLRHSALTQKSKILKEHILRDHAGWSTTSKMPQVYIHYFGNESSNSLLEAYGIRNIQENNSYNNLILRPRQCPNCNESNKPDSKFCIKCKMVLRYDAYTETVENNHLRDIHVLHEKYQKEMKEFREDVSRRLTEVFSMVRQNPKLIYIKPEALLKKKSKF